jgi:hypothetical protein
MIYLDRTPASDRSSAVTEPQLMADGRNSDSGNGVYKKTAKFLYNFALRAAAAEGVVSLLGQAQ